MNFPVGFYREVYMLRAFLESMATEVEVSNVMFSALKKMSKKCIRFKF